MQGMSSNVVKVYIDPLHISDETLVPGTFFNVSLKVSDIPASPGLVGVQFKLNYDPTLLTAVTLDEVMFHNMTPPSDWDNIWMIEAKIDCAAGSVSYACTWQDITLGIHDGYAPISGNHTIATIRFEVKAIGSCVFAFSQPFVYRVKLADTSGYAIPCDVLDGFFNNSPAVNPNFHLCVTPPELTETQVSGSIFNFSVVLDDNFVSNGIMSASFMLTWNPNILEAVNATEIMFHEVTAPNEWNNIRTVLNEINNTEGYYAYACEFVNADRAIALGYAPIMGNHTLSIITLRVKDLGKSILRLANSEVQDIIGQTLTCSSLHSVFMNLLRGDLNADNSVDIYDAIEASHAYGSSQGSVRWNWAADIDENGMVDIYDIILLAANFGKHGRAGS